MADPKTKIAIRDLYKIFGRDPQSVLADAKAGMSKTEMLSKHGHVLGLRDINIDIAQARMSVVMGLSGSGKSTLIRHLNRLIEPTAGSILLDGEDVLSLKAKELRRARRMRMSMVFQRFALFPHRTVLQNAALTLRIRGENRSHIEERAGYWLQRVGLGGYESHYPTQLSGGMQQRVGLARALASDSEIMLMDEAFSALDPLIRTDMQNLLLELQRDLHKTIVFITHDLDEALKLADHLVILKDGAVIQQGEPQRILLHPNDPYIEDFVADINRARVLRVRSIMQALRPESAIGADGTALPTIDENATLEEAIARAGGDVSRSFLVTRGESERVGELSMRELVRSLVPSGGSSGPKEIDRI